MKEATLPCFVICNLYLKMTPSVRRGFVWWIDWLWAAVHEESLRINKLTCILNQSRNTVMLVRRLLQITHCFNIKQPIKVVVWHDASLYITHPVTTLLFMCIWKEILFSSKLLLLSNPQSIIRSQKKTSKLSHLRS